jgi:hypothetical protein
MSNPQQQTGKTKRIAYTVIERSEGKSYWLRVGTVFENRDGSLNVVLDAIPVNGRLQIREYQPDEERDANQGRGGASNGGSNAANGGGAGGGGHADRNGGRRPVTARTG